MNNLYLSLKRQVLQVQNMIRAVVYVAHVNALASLPVVGSTRRDASHNAEEAKSPVI